MSFVIIIPPFYNIITKNIPKKQIKIVDKVLIYVTLKKTKTYFG